MLKLETKQFDNYKKAISDDQKEHDLKMKELNRPEEVIAMYEGRMGSEKAEYADVYENYMSIFIDTIMPTLFYQVPRPMIRAKRTELNYSAAVINALAGYYFNDDAKSENQLCIIDALLPYYFGVMKVGYNSRTGKVTDPNILTGANKPGDPKNLEANTEYLKFERPVLIRHSPKFTYLDSTKPFGKDKRITFEHKRNLLELRQSNLYIITNNFINYFKSRNENEEEIKFDLFEHFCWKEDGIYKLVYIKEWEEPLFWEKTPYKELPRSLLRFKKAPDQLYTTSTGSLAYKAQKELNYLNELWKLHIDHIRRQHLVDFTALDEPGKNSLKANIIDGIVSTTRPVTSGIYQQISSQPMAKDAYANIENVRNYLKLLLSVSGGRGGQSDVEFAETEKNQSQGDFMRMSGLQDSIRDFTRKQIMMMVSNIVRFGNPEITLKITGKDVHDPITGELITGKELQFGGQDGLNLQKEIQGDLESDYIYDVDITSASRPDFAVIRKQLGEAITLATTLRPAMQEKNKDIDVAEMVKDYFNTFDTIPNPDKYIIEMTEEEKAMFKTKQQMAMAATLPKGASMTSAPTEQGIDAGANKVPTGAEGLAL